jgi:hypothetical protein
MEAREMIIQKISIYILILPILLLLVGSPGHAETVTDNFDDNTLNPMVWTPFFSGGYGTVNETNKRLEVSISGNDQGGGVRLNMRALGDFDFQASYTLFTDIHTFPSDQDESGVAIMAFVLDHDPIIVGQLPVSVLDVPPPGGVYFGAEGDLALWGHALTSDLSGKLRLTRVGNTYSTYYWASGNWVLLGSGTATKTGPADLGLVVSIDGDATVSAAFDDFYLQADALDSLPTVSSVNLSTTAGGSAASRTAGSNQTTQTGYATLDVDSGAAPYSTAVFSLKQNGITVSEAGVPASPPTTAARAFIDYRTSVNAIPARPGAGLIDISTGIAVANPNSSTANITYTLRNVSGDTIEVGSGPLDPGAHFAKFINQLNEVAEDFVLPEDFGTTTQFATLEISSDQPVSVIALRIANNQRNEVLFTTTPIADLNQSPANNIAYFPQFADGGGYTTSIVLVNTSNQAETGTIQVIDNEGQPLAANWVGAAAGGILRYNIPVGGAVRFQTDGSSGTSMIGWARLTPDVGTSTPIGTGLFSYNPGNILQTESGVPATTATNHARIYVDLSGGHNTGLAIANPTDSIAEISIRAFQRNGITEAGTNNDPLPLPANGHRGRFANEFVSGLQDGFTGLLDISSATPFVALTMRSLDNERQEFLAALFPIADMTQSAPSPIVFPQIADGGGYATQFILMSAGAESTSTLNFYNDGGDPLAIGR